MDSGYIVLVHAEKADKKQNFKFTVSTIEK